MVKRTTKENNKMNTDGLNVKRFGAKGDGKTDDTRAIQKALDEASHAVLTRQDTESISYPDGIPSRCGYHYHATGPEVLFPCGHYIVTAPLLPRKTLALRGEGYPWIEQKDPGRDIVYCEESIRQSFSGLTFHGGQSHLNLGNSNEDNGFVQVEDCRFYNSKGIAIWMRENSNSTILVIQKCQVVACEQIVVSYTDMTHMRECWLTGGRNRDGALIVTRHDSNFTMENICGVPLVNGHDQRWIDNYGTLICRNSRFGGEEGGFTPVVNFARYFPQLNANMVVLDGCWLVCGLGNNKRKCAVFCEEIPNRIDIHNCNLIGIPPVLVSDRINPRTYFKTRPGMLKYTVEDNVGEFAGDGIPLFLKKPRIYPMAAARVLNERETKAALQKARRYWQDHHQADGSAGETFGGHQRRTKPGDFLEISPARHTWDTGDCVDGSSERCSTYMAVTKVGGRGILVRKANGRDEGGHVTVRNVAINLDRFPWLCWKMGSNGTPAGLAVRVVDLSSRRAILLQEDHADPFSYRAHHLRTLFGIGGKQRFDIKLYYGGHMYKGSRRKEDIVYAGAGDSISFAFLRAETD